MKKILIPAILIATSLYLTGCAIHHPEIQQGNVITDDMVSQLAKGMTKKQVKFVLGTPSIRDPFHPDRWDYVYSLDTGKKAQARKRKHLVVFFKGDRLSRHELRITE